MYSKRIKILQDKLKKDNLDAALIDDKINRYYLSGFRGSSGTILITLKDTYIITDFRYTQQAKEQAPNYKIVEFRKDYYKYLAQIISDNNIKKLALVYDKITYTKYNKLIENLNTINIRDISGILVEMRSIKGENEINEIKKAQAITDNTFKHIISIIKPGMTEKDLALEIEYFVKKNGAEDISFDTIVASGKRASMPHATASNKIMEKGDMVTIDFGCIYNGYCSDMTRTIVLGYANEKFKNIYNITLNSQMEALSKIKSGINCKEADNYSRRIISNEGYEDNFGHGLGHGVGLEIHEKPSLSPSSEDVLKEGMVVTVEPGIYLQDFGGVRIEDMGLVTKDGFEIFTNSNKELILI